MPRYYISTNGSFRKTPLNLACLSTILSLSVYDRCDTDLGLHLFCSDSRIVQDLTRSYMLDRSAWSLPVAPAISSSVPLTFWKLTANAGSMSVKHRLVLPELRFYRSKFVLR